MDRLQEKERARKRRHHKERIRERARQYAKHVFGHNERDYDYNPNRCLYPDQEASSREEAIRMLVENEAHRSETRPRCSCSMCGNPRRYWDRRTEKLTRQELKYLDAACAQVLEYEESCQETDWGFLAYSVRLWVGARRGALASRRRIQSDARRLAGSMLVAA